MKNILSGACAVLIAAAINGCVYPGPPPQKVPLRNPDGKAVIIKDIYDIPGIASTKLDKTEIIKVFFPQADNIKSNFSMTVVKIPSGISQAKHKQPSAQIFYALYGGGKLTIDGNILVLKKGIMVYVPPNAVMSITNNVNETLQLVVVTTPPFDPSKVQVLEKPRKRVTIAKDDEDLMQDEEMDIQSVSEKYKTKKAKRRKALSVEEYREKIGEDFDFGNEKDPLANLLENETDVTKEKKLKWPLKMPDDTQTPLNQLEREQREQLLPVKPQKIQNTKLKDVQIITKKEQQVPVYKDEKSKKATGKSKIKATDKEIDSLEKLLKDQEKREKDLIPKKALKRKKTSLKHVQELTPEENAAPEK